LVTFAAKEALDPIQIVDVPDMETDITCFGVRFIVIELEVAKDWV
jgi:hypothetical protein